MLLLANWRADTHAFAWPRALLPCPFVQLPPSVGVMSRSRPAAQSLRDCTPGSRSWALQSDIANGRERSRERATERWALPRRPHDLNSYHRPSPLSLAQAIRPRVAAIAGHPRAPQQVDTRWRASSMPCLPISVACDGCHHSATAPTPAHEQWTLSRQIFNSVICPARSPRPLRGLGPCRRIYMPGERVLTDPRRPSKRAWRITYGRPVGQETS